MNLNKDYWVKRYTHMNAYNVVGHRSWDFNTYISETEKFFKHTIDYLPKKKEPNSTVIDFGCGIGRCIPLLTSRFDYYWGVDIIKNIIDNNINKYGNKFVKFKHIHEDGRIPLNIKANMIFTNVVLQHIMDDELLKFYFMQFRALIKNDGYVLMIENMEPKDDLNFIKFRSLDQYKSLLKPLFNVSLVDQFVSSKEEHGVFKANPK